MNVNSLTRIALLAAACSGLYTGRLAAGAETIATYLADDVTAAARLNVQRLDLPAVLNQLIELKLLPEKERERAREDIKGVQKALTTLQEKGARNIYVLLRASDLAAGGPAWVVETESPEQARAVAAWLAPIVEGFPEFGDIATALPKAIKTEGPLVVGGPTKERLDKIIAARTDTPRDSATAAVDVLQDADLGLVVFGDDDGRRVVREMFPQLPAPFMEIDGELLAEGIAWAGIQVKLPPEPIVTLALQASGGESADILATAFNKAREVLKVLIAAEAVSGVPNHQKRAAALMPMVPRIRLDRDETRLSLTFGDDEEELTFLRYALPAMTQDLRDDAYRSSRMNSFKQIALGMFNYESAKGTYPPAASYDENGRPLLSWRVHILPYLEEAELYKQFKLDEPWDSEHNRKLIEKMPAVYADPSSEVRSAIGDEGRTTYVVPTGEGLMFGGKEGFKHRAIKDGTSNTILVVEIPPEKAVVWTKPEDWEVDLNEPLKGLARPDRQWFTAGYADGHVSIHGTKDDPQLIRALLTPNGKEVIDHSKRK